MSGLATKEGTDGRTHVKCPNCSRMYATTDEKGEQLDVPGKCKRCSCPMDARLALAFSEEQARNGPNRHRASSDRDQLVGGRCDR